MGYVSHAKQSARFISSVTGAINRPLHYINGKRCQPAPQEKAGEIVVVNPATGRSRIQCNPILQ